MLGFELDAFLTGLQPNGRYYGRPTDADKQSIGAGHIGHSIGCVPRVFPGSPREYISTAYSGSTAINARSAIASACGISFWASSAAQDSMKAAPKIATPELNASRWGAG